MIEYSDFEKVETRVGTVIESKFNKYFNSYEGYISSHDCDQADDNELKRLANKIRKTKLK